jgi:microsomal dipeptidase-like Zn-dependent dipeptidase
MMKRAMLVDMEHMSQRSTDDSLAIAKSANYPVVLSHAWFRDLKLPREDPSSAPHWNDQRSEMHSSAKTIEAIRDLGGVIGVLTNQGYVVGSDEGPGKNDCDTSSKSFAMAYLYAVRKTAGKGGVGLGTDFNGLAGQPGPRFEKIDGCGGSDADPDTQRHQVQLQSNKVLYDGQTPVDGRPLSRDRVGDRIFDFNNDGLAHYGLIPDLIADLHGIGMPAEALNTLFSSAGAYITMWRAAESQAKTLRSGR